MSFLQLLVVYPLFRSLLPVSVFWLSPRIFLSLRFLYTPPHTCVVFRPHILIRIISSTGPPCSTVGGENVRDRQNKFRKNE